MVKISYNFLDVQYGWMISFNFYLLFLDCAYQGYNLILIQYPQAEFVLSLYCEYIAQ